MHLYFSALNGPRYIYPLNIRHTHLSLHPTMHSWTYHLYETDAIAERILELYGQQHIFLFYGEMGSGKTTLIKSLCKAWGVEETTSSPTFAIVHTYRGVKNAVYHLDLFRLRDIQELLAIGFDEYIDSDSPVCIEWPELALPMFRGMQAVLLHLRTIDADTRMLEMEIRTI